MKDAYCEMCERFFAMTRTTWCPLCGDKLRKLQLAHLTRQERLQALADLGCDTWEEKRGER
jgi:hypothetical protein